jgi:hypothetical protein
MSFSIANKNQTQKPSSQASVRAEAERRAKFVRNMGGSVSGYCDGYADGFEHAVAWLQGQACDPLAVEYRPDSGMGHSKDYYKYRPKERAQILEWFEKMAANPAKKSTKREDDFSR